MGKVLGVTKIYNDLKKELKEKISLCSHTLNLASIKIGKSDSAELYICSQKNLAKELGIKYTYIEFNSKVKEIEVVREIEKLNRDKKITGIILNKPFPSTWKEENIFSKINYKKDIEGVSPYNLGLLCSGEPLFVSPVVLSILELLDATGIDIYGKNITLVGFSTIIGKPLVLILAKRFATVSITHIATYKTGHLEFYVKNADVLISAVGRPCLIKAKWIKKKAIVIDAGTAVNKEGKIVGDVEFDLALKKVSWITPVPNGVGKLTTLFLFRNLLKTIELKEKNKNNY